MREGSKQVFFAKKNHKTFCLPRRAFEGAKVFRFLFAKKNAAFLECRP
jgi:hypothetical protein